MTNKLITKNKKAYFDYEITDSFEAGIELFGHEVKSMRNGHVNLKGAYISFISQVPIIKGMHITPWKALPNRDSIASNRDIKIFIHKKTINLLAGKQKEGGYSIIPLELYFKGSLVKLKIGLGKGRKKHDKKQLLKERTLDKEAKKMMSKYV